MTQSTKDLVHLAHLLKAPRIGAMAETMAERARVEAWSYEEYLAAVLEAEAAARSASGAEGRIKGAGFPARKTIDAFDFVRQPALRAQIAALKGSDYLERGANVVLLGPPGVGKTHLAIGLGIAAAQAGHRVLFGSATEWVSRLAEAHATGRLPAELARLRRYRLLVIDEVGYLPFEREAANLFFQLVSSRYEHASVILTSNLPFSRWGEVFSDQVVAAVLLG